MVYTPAQALARAKAKVGKPNEVGMCLKGCVNVYGIPAPYRFAGNGRAWAYNYWLNAVLHGKVVKTSDPAKVPAGALLFHAPRPYATTTGGKAGHVAIGAGGGYEYSTDRPVNGKWGKVTIRSVESAWGKKLVGYILTTGDGVKLMDAPTTTPAVRHTSSVLVQNCASRRNDIGAGSWSKRLPILAKTILDSDASFIVCPELYSTQRPALTKAISAKYAEAAIRGGRVLYYRKGRWASSTGFWWKYLNGLSKPAICDIFINVENKTRLTVSGWHTSYQTTLAGSAARRKEVRNGIEWIKGLKLNYGRNIYAGDFNSPADGSTRIDDVEPVFESFGYHDLEDDHEVANGPGGYHLDRVFAGDGVKGERIVVVRHNGSDHPATYVEFSY